MNLSFSTRGWGECSWEDNVATAETMHFGGIELYKTEYLGGPFIH